MSSTVVVRGAGGAIFEMDVPTSGPALARWNEYFAKGDLVIVDKPAPAEVAPEPAAVPVKKTPARQAKPAAKDKTSDDTEE